MTNNTITIDKDINEGDTITINGETFTLNKTADEPKHRLFNPTNEGCEVICAYSNWHCLSTPVFTTNYTYAEAMAEAITTIWEVKLCEGVVEPMDDVEQFSICADGRVGINFDIHNTREFLFPCFSTEAQALAAIDKVGKDRIIKAYETWHMI